MENIQVTNQMRRAFLDWLHGEIESGRLSAPRAIEDVTPIDLAVNRDLNGPIEILTYFNG